MTVAFNLSEEDTKFVESYAAGKHISITELARQMFLDGIEDEMALCAYRDARAEYDADPVTYSHEEMRKMLELD